MPESLLTILKLVFLALLWLFFVRVLRAVWAELRDPPLSTAPAGPAPVPAAASVPRAAPSYAPRPSAGPSSAGPGADDGAGELRVVEPVERRGQTFVLADEVTVGRGGGCGVALDDRMVSQLHARIFRGPGGGLFVEDLGSTNGTLVNQAKVSGATPLRRGDRLQVGRTVLELAAPDASRSGASRRNR